MRAQRLRVRRTARGAFGVGQRRVERIEVRVHRHLRVDRHEAPARQPHGHVGPQAVAIVTLDARLLAEVDIVDETRHLGDISKRHLAPAPALAVVAQRARQGLCGARCLLLELGDLLQLLAERLHIALALLAELLDELLVLRQLLLERKKRRVDRLLPRLEILLGKLVLALELLLRLAQQLLGRLLEHIGARRLEGLRERRLRLLDHGLQLDDRLLALGEDPLHRALALGNAFLVRAQLLLRLRSKGRLLLGALALGVDLGAEVAQLLLRGGERGLRTRLPLLGAADLRAQRHDFRAGGRKLGLRGLCGRDRLRRSASLQHEEHSRRGRAEDAANENSHHH